MVLLIIMIIKRTIVLSLLILTGIASLLYGDIRKGNIELFVLLDKSLSMEEEIDSVTEYVSEELVDQLLIPGDMFVLINFYGETDLFYVGELEDDDDFRTIKADIASIRADGRFTDIGSALDRLQSTVEEIPADPARKRYLLLLTDGKQEAPPQSPYFTPDGSFNHKLLEHTKEIARKGWKIHILGIGTDSAAEELARELSAAFSSVGDTPSRREISESLSAFSIRIDAALKSSRLQTGPDRVRIPMSFTVSGAEGGDAETPGTLSIEIEEVLFRPEGSDTAVSLGKASPISIPYTPDEGGGEGGFEHELIVSISGTSAVPALPSKGELLFRFSGSTIFQPAVFDVVLLEESADEPETAPEESGFIVRYWPFLLAALIILIIVIRMVMIEIEKKRRNDDNRPRNPLE
jgi:hypothetical protein